MQQRAEDEQAPKTKAQRYRQIVATLAKHGIGVVGEQIGKNEDERDQAWAQHVRTACEELGTTFIKLGQALSTRADLLPDAYRAELLKLQDDVPPVPYAAIREILREELGAAPEELFASFDPVPSGSASIGQVHAARLADGREVMVKVRKPDVQHLVEMDLQILDDLAQSWSERFPVLQEYDVRALVREFGDSLMDELDYTREAANLRSFRELFAKERGFVLPEAISEYSTGRVLTLTRVDGSKPSEVTLSGRRRATLARRISRFVLEPAFTHGIFYADPHAGNFLIGENGALGVIDFGMIGRLTPDTRRRVADMFVSMDRRDAQRLSDRLVELAPPSRPLDRTTLVNSVNRLLERYVDVSMENVRFGEAMGELLEIVRANSLRLPGNLAQLFKALAMCEGLLQEFDPDASLSDHLEPLAHKMVYERASGDQWVDRMRDSALDAAELSIELPRRIDRVLGEVERGNLRVWTRVEEMDAVLKRFEHIVERANATMLAAACIVAIAIVMLFYHPNGWQNWIGAIFWIAVVAAVVHVVRTLWALRK